jgi:hypothetical protein
MHIATRDFTGSTCFLPRAKEFALSWNPDNESGLLRTQMSAAGKWTLAIEGNGRLEDH